MFNIIIILVGRLVDIKSKTFQTKIEDVLWSRGSIYLKSKSDSVCIPRLANKRLRPLIYLIKLAAQDQGPF